MLTGIMGPMVAPTLKLGIALLSGGNVAVQQVHGCTLFSHPVVFNALQKALGYRTSNVCFCPLGLE